MYRLGANGMTLRCLQKRAFWASLLLLGTTAMGLSAGQGDKPSSQTSGETPDVHLGKGYEALKQENYEEAVNEFRAALKIDPTLVLRARFPLAISLVELHKGAEARQELETVRHETGEHPNISYYFGRLDIEDRKYESAIRNLKQALANPPFPDTAYYLGFAYLRQGETEAAEKWLKEAEKLIPNDSRVSFQLGNLYNKEGRSEEAKQAFERSKRLREGNQKEGDVKRECAQYLDRADMEKANIVCEQLYDPDNVEKLTALGILYGQHGYSEKALKPLRRAAELAPQSPQMQYNLAYTYFQLNQFAEARGALEPAAKRWPDLFPLNALYGAVLWKLGETLPAYQALHRANQLNADDSGTADLLYLSTLALAAGSEESAAHSDAIRYLEEAARLRPTEAEPHKRMAQLYAQLGQPKKAGDEQREADRLAKSTTN